MQIIITGTNEVKTLSITDNNGIEWTQDLIGNVGALHTNEDGNATMSKVEYDWWANQIAEIEQADELLAEFDGDNLENIKSMLSQPPTEETYLADVRGAIARYRQLNNL